MQGKGFTLIEFIIVVIVLGILAVVAAPKFFDLSREARISNLQAVKGAVDSLADIVEAKARIEGIANGNVNIPGNLVMQVRDFSPVAHWNNNFRYILELPGAPFGFTNINTRCAQEVCGVGFQSNWPARNSTLNSQIADLNNNRRAVFIWLEGYRLDEECYVYFVEKELSNANTQILTGVIDNGC